MLRNLTVILALLGLSLGSCSSSPSATELGINPDINTRAFHPRPRGMEGTGAAFDKYWLASDALNPYAGSEAPNAWYHFLTPWNWGKQESFGDVTVRDFRPHEDLLIRPNAAEMFDKWVFNDDVRDPYHD